MEDFTQQDNTGQQLEHQSSHDVSNKITHGFFSESKPQIHISISDYTKALIKVWTEGGKKPQVSPNRIFVSQTVSFLAFLYEKMRNAVEFREEHLIRRAAIERIIKRRMLLNENGRDIAEPLIKELLWARYYENGTIGEESVAKVQSTIDKYFFLRNEISAGRKRSEQEKIASFTLEVLSCEIDEILSPSLVKREAFVHFVYQLVRQSLAPIKGNVQERDIQAYIAIERAFAHSDDSTIRYSILRLMIPEISDISWQNADKILPRYYEIYNEIEKNLVHPLRDKIRNFYKKQMPPFFILRDIFEQNPKTIEQILTDETTLKHKVDEACRKRYEETKSRLRRMGIRSFIYILLTKVIFAFLIELPYDIYVLKKIAYFPIIVNIIIPPVLMSIIILSVTVPGDENTRKIYSFIRQIIEEDPEKLPSTFHPVSVDKYAKSKSVIFTALFTLFYLLTYLISFGAIIYVLTKLNFNPVSQGIFIFFITLVTFFAFRVINITQEYLVIDRDSPLTPLVDFFFLPILRVGQWLSGEVLAKFNILIFLFDFIVEMPLKAVVEVIDEWVRFVKLKKEEII
mgnify:CR=1 FL=1